MNSPSSRRWRPDRKSTRLNSSHVRISYAVFCLKKKKQYQVVCHAWVLMNNHYHLLLETPNANLAQALRHLNGVYTQAFNRRHRRVGHLFQGRYKAIVVEKEAYLLELCRYVVLNPVRAKMVTQPRAWKWSSEGDRDGR